MLTISVTKNIWVTWQKNRLSNGWNNSYVSTGSYRWHKNYLYWMSGNFKANVQKSRLWKDKTDRIWCDLLHNLKIYKTSARNVLKSEAMGSFSVLSGIRVTNCTVLCVSDTDREFSPQKSKTKSYKYEKKIYMYIEWMAAESKSAAE